MHWMNSRVRPPLLCRTVSTSVERPGKKRSWPIRSSGPLGMSRIPVASTTITPGSPSANRPYQSSTSWVTNPSSVARQGTIAGTQLLSRSSSPEASRRGENIREVRASSAVGLRRTGSGCLIRGDGFHMAYSLWARSPLAMMSFWISVVPS